MKTGKTDTFEDNHQEKLFRITFENAAVGMTHVHPDGYFMRVNKKMSEITGYSREELLKKSFQEITHPDDLNDDLQQVEELSRGEIDSYSMEKRYIKKDGTIVWVVLTVSAVVDAERNLEFFISVVEDITKRKQAEEALKENKERLQAALEGGKMGTWDLDLKTGRVIRSLRHDQIWGYPQGINNWSLETALNQVVKEDHQVIKDAYEKAYKTGLLYHENRITWPDGSVHWIAAGGSIRYNKNGEPMRVTGIVEDITRRKEAELKLQESEKKFRMLANNIPQLVWMADNEGKIFWYNQRWLDYTGNSTDRIEGWGWKKTVHPDYLDQLQKTVTHAIKTNEDWEELVPLKNKSGEYKWFLFGAIPVWDELANSTRWFGTATDITRQREIEDLLKKDKDLVENLLFIAAHDLKGPVANMYSALNLMDSLSLEKKLSLLGHFRKISDQLGKTIHGVTEILRVRNTDYSSATTVYFEGLLNSILLELKEELNISSIKRDFSGKPTIHYIETFLHSIMINLVSNSIKYRRDEVPLHIEISTRTEGNYTVLSVKDNGIGIDLLKYGNKLFSPFQRLEVDKATGTGIGLFLIKNIIEKNGGYIKVESQPNDGTTFYCYLKEYPKEEI